MSTNTYRQSAAYKSNIRKLANFEGTMVMPDYLILVGVQDAFVESISYLGGDSIIENITNITNAYMSQGAPIISIIDYHTPEFPCEEMTCRYGYLTKKPHNMPKQGASPITLMDRMFYEHLYRYYNFCGVLKRNGDTQNAPLTELTSLIDARNSAYTTIPENALLFPPAFHICGFFTEDMITHIAIELRKKYPNSYIDIDPDYNVSINNIVNEVYDVNNNTGAAQSLSRLIDTDAVVTETAVLEDIEDCVMYPENWE